MKRKTAILVGSFYSLVFASLAVFGICARAATNAVRAEERASLGSSVYRVAQVPNPAPAAPSFNDLILALSGHHWTILFGIGLFLLVGFAKQGWLSAWLASKVPTGYQPLLALVLSLLALAGSQIAAGAAVVPAILQALEAAAMAVFTHQVIVEGVRKGKELVPATKTVAASRPIPPSKP